MIRQTEQPPRDTIPEPILANYRLDDSPRRREGGSLLFAATAPDGARATLQVSADAVASRRGRVRFRRLARARAAVDHPALLRVHEIGEERGRVFMATDPFPTGSLADLLRDGPLEPALALKLLKAVADGLDAAHAAGVVHRTLSAESILLDGERVNLDLFGVFTVVGQASWGDVVRRDPHLHYESPEGVRGEELVPASNVYSFAGLLIHALTGEQPFAHHDPVMISYAHLTQAPPKPTERKPELPSGLDALVARGMSKDPAERPESTRALVAAAATLLGPGSTSTPTPTAGPTPRPANGTPAAYASSKAGATAASPDQPRSTAATPATPDQPRSPVSLVAAYVASGAASEASRADAPAPSAAAPATVPPAPVAAEPAARPRMPLSAWLAPLGPVLLVFVVAAAFGALLGLPGGGPEQAATSVRSPEQQAVQRLDEVRFRLRDELGSASTPDEQAAAAQRLAMAYGRAADHLTSPALIGTAQEASIAYLAVESAARDGDQKAYDDARARVEAAEKQVENELAQMNRSRTPG